MQEQISACANADQKLSLCTICERNIDPELLKDGQKVEQFKIGIVGDELQCSGFKIAKIHTRK